MDAPSITSIFSGFPVAEPARAGRIGADRIVNESERRPAPGGSAMAKILVADDRLTNREVPRGMPVDANHRVIEAADGLEALDLRLLTRHS